MATDADRARGAAPPATEWEILGRLTDASNATLLVEAAGIRYVYKPVAGETPLWDFPARTLGRREVAVHGLARVLGWDIVPRTMWVDGGPFGPGMLQEWVESTGSPVSLFPPQEVPAGWLGIARGYDHDDREVVLAHADSPELARVALFDVIVNNADRKGGHLLTTAGGGLAAIDHGLCLNEEYKLRTVLWGFAGRDVPAELVADVRRALPGLHGAARQLSRRERVALVQRAERVVADPVFPRPRRRGPTFPWPPL